MVALPNKPSALIEVALKDLTKVERNKKYVIHMNTSWHEGIGCVYEVDAYGTNTGKVLKPAKKCAVCFAGAVIANTLETKFGENKTPNQFDSETAAKLNALDSFRQGEVAYALETFYQAESFSRRMDRNVVSYGTRNSAKFKKQMRQLAKDLKAFGM